MEYVIPYYTVGCHQSTGAWEIVMADKSWSNMNN